MSRLKRRAYCEHECVTFRIENDAMMRFYCPECGKALAVDASRVGKPGSCPACKSKFTIPAGRIDDENTARGRKNESAGGTGVATDEPPDADDESATAGGEQAGSARPKRRRKRKKSAKTWFPSRLASGFPLALFVFVSVTLAYLVLVNIWRPAAYVAVGLGWLLTIIGWFWLIMTAFEEGAMLGMLCIVLPPFALYHAVMHFDDAKEALFVHFAGIILLALGRATGSFDIEPLPDIG